MSKIHIQVTVMRQKECGKEQLGKDGLLSLFYMKDTTKYFVYFISLNFYNNPNRWELPSFHKAQN